jgi:hypothetical protein
VAVQMEAVMLCDFAADYDGRLSIMGGCITRVYARQLPAVHQLYFVARPAYLDAQEALRPHQFSVDVESPEGARVVNLGGGLQPLRTEDDPNRDPRTTLGFNLIFPLPIPLKEAGLHVVVFSFDEIVLARLPVMVELVES